MIGRALKRWREARVHAKTERARVGLKFESFLNETKPYVPAAPKYPEAALFRHAWKRAAVLEIIYQRAADEPTAALYRGFQELASKQYYRVAPAGAYGTIPLRMEAKAATHLLQDETRRLAPPTAEQRQRIFACIYVGRDEEGRLYVGQTLEAPERRWVQHRADGTGPFKTGGQYAKWEVIHGEISPSKLDELESYYIGRFNTYEDGHNDNRGNDWTAYERGRADRASVSETR